MELTRRGFIRLLGASVASAASSKIAIADHVVPDSKDRWIRDEGDFYRLRVPAMKTFSGESFDKPLLLILEEGAIFRDCAVEGFVNIHGQHGWAVTECLFNSGRYAHLERRAVVRIYEGAGYMSGVTVRL